MKTPAGSFIHLVHMDLGKEFSTTESWNFLISVREDGGSQMSWGSWASKI